MLNRIFLKSVSIISANIPDKGNLYYSSHVTMMRRSFKHWMGRDLLEVMEMSDYENQAGDIIAKRVFEAPWALLSHDTKSDAVLNYATLYTLELFQLSWSEFTSMPSRLTVESHNREERRRLLEQVSQQGFINNYSGIRVAKGGKRFHLKNAFVWNLVDENRNYAGQAALFRNWKYL